MKKIDEDGGISPVIKHRHYVVCLIIVAVICYILLHLMDTTVIHSENWNNKAMSDLSKTEIIYPERGDILACDGSILATNAQYYTIRIDYRSEKFMEDIYIDSMDVMCDSLAKYFPIRNAKEWKERLMSQMKKPKNRRSRSFKILDNVTYDKYLKLKTFPFFRINNPNKNGLVKEEKMRRINPYGDMAILSIGAVGETKNREKHGIWGLERALDSLLYGRAGITKKVPLTTKLVNWTDTPAVAGYTVKTTIDIGMQDILENELMAVLNVNQANWGTAILMEVATGDIKAISNLERDSTTGEYIEAMNRAIVGYELGSVMKTFSMAIALEDGLVNNLDSMIDTRQPFRYGGGRPITDSHFVPAMPVKDVLMHSSNIAIAKIMTRYFGHDLDGWVARVKSTGFTEKLNSGIAGEYRPTFEKLDLDRGGKVTFSRQTYGYNVLVPPLHMLSIYNAIANDGKYVRPRLAKELIKDGKVDSVLPVTYVRERLCSEKKAKILQDMLYKVVFDNGTAKLLRSDIVEIAGKTGTANIIKNGKHIYGRNRVTFCGYFPAKNPMYSCIVVIEDAKKYPKGAPSASGTVLKNTALKMFSRGLLNNSSDYKDKTTPNTKPILFASLDQNKCKVLKDELGLSFPGQFNASENVVDSGIPNLVGFGVRDAINILEKNGYNAVVSGSGYVVKQEPIAGTMVSPGTTVKITLSQM